MNGLMGQGHSLAACTATLRDMCTAIRHSIRMRGCGGAYRCEESQERGDENAQQHAQVYLDYYGTEPEMKIRVQAREVLRKKSMR